MNGYMKHLKTSALNAAFIFLFIWTSTVFAQVLSRDEALEKQNRAEELSRQWSAEAIRHASEIFLQAADDWTKSKEFSKVSNCLREAARLKFILLDYKAAKDVLRKAIELDRKNVDAVSEAKSHALMSLVLLQEGEIEESEAFYKKAVELADSTADSHALACAYYSAAEFSYFQKDIEQTVELFEKSRLFVEKTADTRLTAEILTELSYSYLKQGNGDAGLKTAQESLL